MQDLTKGSVAKHVLGLSAFIAFGMLFQSLYFIVDMLCVGRLGAESIAAVGLAGNLVMVTLALTQSLNVGTTTVVSHAIGAKERDKAEWAFNQSFILSTSVGIVVTLFFFFWRFGYMRAMHASPEVEKLGATYLAWFVPTFGLQYVLSSFGGALRGSGVIKPTMAVGAISVLLNVILAPILVLGWPFGPKWGVAGAGIASFAAVLIATIGFIIYYMSRKDWLKLHFSMWKPDFGEYWKILKIGAPSGGEFLLLAVYLFVVYGIIAKFGPSAQAGFTIGGRIMQTMFMPVMAVSFASAPVVGQNFGARHPERVREAFKVSAILATSLMLVNTVLSHIAPDVLVRIFSKEAAVITFGSEYLNIIAWNFVASGLIFACSAVFQGLGHTLPSLASSFTRLLLFAIPAWWIGKQENFNNIKIIWWMSVASYFVQLVFSLFLVRREMRLKLDGLQPLPENLPLDVMPETGQLESPDMVE